MLRKPAKLSVWVSVDPLTHETLEPYVFTGNNAIMLVDPDGRRDYYSIAGKLIKSDALEGPPVVILSSATLKMSLLKAIDEGHITEIPKPEVFVKMDEMYDLTKETGFEHAMAVKDNVCSEIYSGDEDSVPIGDAWGEIRRETGEFADYDVHTHPYSGKSYDTYMPSTPERKENESAIDTHSPFLNVTKLPSIVLGHKQVEVIEFDKIGSPDRINTRYMSFYTKDGMLGRELNYEQLKKLSSDVYKNEE